MRVTIIGAGRVGSTLGARLAQVGHEISYVVRDAGSTKHGQLQETASHITADIGSATADADAIIVALPWSEVESCLKKAGPLNGKMIIDATNPLELSEAGLARGLTIGHDSSGGEKIAQWLPNAHVSKAFNTVGVEVMQNPIINGESSTLFVCGEPQSNKIAAQLARDLGFVPVEIGDIRLARLIEPFGMLWIHLRFALGWSPDFALIANRATTAVR